MKRYIKYSKKYRIAIALFTAASATIATAAAIGSYINSAPNMLNNVAFTSTLFFVPTVADPQIKNHPKKASQTKTQKKG